MKRVSAERPSVTAAAARRAGRGAKRVGLGESYQRRPRPPSIGIRLKNAMSSATPCGRASQHTHARTHARAHSINAQGSTHEFGQTAQAAHESVECLCTAENCLQLATRRGGQTFKPVELDMCIHHRRRGALAVRAEAGPLRTHTPSTRAHTQNSHTLKRTCTQTA